MRLFQKPDIAIDLGTSKFSLFVKGEGTVASEPAYIAFRMHKGRPASVIAIGRDAQAMKGTAPADKVLVLNPMRHGVVENAEAAHLLLRKLGRKAGLVWGLRPPHTVVTSILGATDLERRTFAAVAAGLGGSSTVVIDEPLAAANALPLNLSQPFAQLICDVGEGASEIIVVAAGRKVCGRSLRIGGDAIDQGLIRYVRRHYQILLSKDQARLLKESLSEAPQTLSLRGLDSTTKRPARSQCSRRELQGVVDAITQPIVAMLRDLLTELSPGAYVDLIESGLYLCGGGAFISGLKEQMEEASRLKVTRMPDPEAAVIQGCGRILDYVRYISD